MTKSCPAIYEDGVLRLIEPLPLKNGAAVEVLVTMPNTDCATDLAEIAALPMEGTAEKAISVASAPAEQKKPRTSLAEWAEANGEHWGDKLSSQDVEGFTGRRY